MKKSLQEIEDRYVSRGFRGAKLKAAIEKDEEYRLLLEERKKKIKKSIPVSEKDKKQYVLSTDSDMEILGKVYMLEKKKLSNGESKLLVLIKSQLKLDWRTPLIRQLDWLLKKYT